MSGRRGGARWAALPVLVLGLVGAISGCTPKDKRGPSSPQRVVEAHLAALTADDPRAAYALLSDEVQAKTPYPSFEARWKADAEERAATVQAARTRTDAELGVVREGSTVHDGGHVVTWTEVDGRYLVASGLPGRVQSATPAQAVRAFIVAVRKADLAEVRALLTDDFAAALDEDWQARVDAMEAALEEPGALELSGDARRAALRYEPQHAVTLRQTEAGWRIVSLQ